MNNLGIVTTCNDDFLKEIKPPYENYYKLEKSNNTWLFGLFMVEKQNNPYLKEIKKFDSETEGAKYFLLNRLSAYYFSERVRQFIMRYDELDIGGATFNASKLNRAMSLIGIPSSTLVIGKLENKRLDNRIIKLTEEDEASFIVSFIDSNGKVIQSTIPLDYQRALFIVFKKVYLLYLFEREVSGLLDKKGLKKDISDKDISIFLS